MGISVCSQEQKMQKCYIVGAGECFGLDFSKDEGDYIIAADAGYRYLMEAGKVPDMVVGDFDTLKYLPEHPNVVQLPCEKDVTDTWEAVTRGLDKGYKEFHIYGCTGGRIEHTIANIQLLARIAEEGGSGYLYDEKSILTVIKDSEIAFDESFTGYISVFSLAEKSSGVTIEGLKYETVNVELSNSFPLGVSNEFTGKASKISVDEGCLLIVYPKK